jgi:hypothetical protein
VPDDDAAVQRLDVHIRLHRHDNHEGAGILHIENAGEASRLRTAL